MTARRLYLVSYDIAHRRRWRRVFRTLHKTGEWVQLSVFLCRLAPPRMLRLDAELRGLIDPAEDRLLVVDLGPAEAAPARIAAGAAGIAEAAPWPRLV